MNTRLRELTLVVYNALGQPPSDDTSTGDTSDEDLVSNLGNEIKVTLDRWSVGQLGIVDLIAAVVVVGAGFVLAWLANRIVRRVARNLSGAALTAMGTIGQIAGGSIILLAIALALEILGFGLGPILVLIFVAVVAVLLIRPMITNLSSGLLLQLRGSLDVGDLVMTTGGILGVVVEITTRTVAIDTSDGRRVHVPNSDVLNDVIVNYSTRGCRRSSFEVMVPCDEDLDVVRSTMLMALSQVAEIHTDPQPEVQVARLVGHVAVFRAFVWHASELAAQRATIDASVRSVVAELRAAGVSLGVPTVVELELDRIDAEPDEA